MYRSEQKFSEAFLPILKKHCKVVWRIESGGTGRGIPDIYCRFPTTELWIELKNDPRQSLYNFEYEVAWRAGQQAWHLEYYRVAKRSVLTIVALRDGFIILPLTKRWPGNHVPAVECFRMTELRDIWGVVKGFIYV